VFLLGLLLRNWPGEPVWLGDLISKPPDALHRSDIPPPAHPCEPSQWQDPDDSPMSPCSHARRT
jgi:hypothetical protein